MKSLGAPFPYYGGKARLADAVWRELGDVTVYAEPFAGSLAVLLASEPHRREIVCDTDGHIVNFWRALRNDPDGVAFHAVPSSPSSPDTAITPSSPTAMGKRWNWRPIIAVTPRSRMRYATSSTAWG